jgi:hypothetical protein
MALTCRLRLVSRIPDSVGPLIEQKYQVVGCHGPSSTHLSGALESNTSPSQARILELERESAASNARTLWLISVVRKLQTMLARSRGDPPIPVESLSMPTVQKETESWLRQQIKSLWEQEVEAGAKEASGVMGHRTRTGVMRDPRVHDFFIERVYDIAMQQNQLETIHSLLCWNLCRRTQCVINTTVYICTYADALQ